MLSVLLVKVHHVFFFLFLAVAEFLIFASTSPSNSVLLVRSLPPSYTPRRLHPLPPAPMRTCL
jgi:hypothetical protein